jgi:ribosomal protein S20
MMPDPSEAIQSTAIKDFLEAIQRQFAANVGVAFSQIKEAHDDAVNKLLILLQQADKKLGELNKENERLKAEVDSLKKLISEKTQKTTAEV